MVTIFKLSSDRLLPLAAILCVNIYIVSCATQAEERSSQKVTIKMYDLSPSDWTSSKKSTFAIVLAAEATSYCNSSPSSCGLDSGVVFTSSEIGPSSAEDDGNSIEFTFYIDYPISAAVTAGGATAYVIPKSAVQAIAGDARDEVKDQVGYYITYVDDEYYSIPPDTDTNRIIIPIAIIAVIALGISVIIMHHYKKNKARQKTIQERRERKKQYGGTSSLNNTTTTILTPINSTTPRHGIVNNNNGINNASIRFTGEHKMSTKEKSSPNRWEEDQDPIVVLKTKSYATNSTSVNEFHSGKVEGYGDRNNALEPLSIAETLEEEEARRERKRRRKERRREKKRREDGVMETSYENHAFNTSNISDGSNLPPSVEVDD